ncbi:hypothetical protein BDZ94DRAFT_1249436 [Collybia nuda]|uniref:Uncharacterized protein n=1 Tax=Collybia nuda TaxID=64659 RepID=A0A9P5YEZ5_9AGAR|nr:hypothetical protein BDZ94DRAFT_1249436 [Collybia nuda]
MGWSACMGQVVRRQQNWIRISYFLSYFIYTFALWRTTSTLEPGSWITVDGQM